MHGAIRSSTKGTVQTEDKPSRVIITLLALLMNWMRSKGSILCEMRVVAFGSSSSKSKSEFQWRAKDVRRPRNAVEYPPTASRSSALGESIFGPNGLLKIKYDLVT